MKRATLVFVVALSVTGLTFSAANAQTTQTTTTEREVTTSKVGWIFPAPKDTGAGTQLAEFGPHMVLMVLDVKGEWYHVRFTNRSKEIVVGYTQARFLVVPQGSVQTAPKSQKLGPINRSKFDAVYRAGKAVGIAQYGGNEREFRALLLKFETEASIAKDKASGSGEATLASLYNLAQLQFQLGLVTSDMTRQDHWKEASATLAKADKVYLGK